MMLDRFLQVVTVEPGCYFIDALLVPAMKSSNASKFFNSEQISRFRGSGGVRIESDVVLFSFCIAGIIFYCGEFYCSSTVDNCFVSLLCSMLMPMVA